jgi:hypothetical protein
MFLLTRKKGKKRVGKDRGVAGVYLFNNRQNKTDNGTAKQLLDLLHYISRILLLSHSCVGVARGLLPKLRPRA